MNQKMKKMLGGILAGFLVFILLLFIISSCTKKEYTYEKLEEKMLSVSKDYFKNHKNELPEENKQVSLTLKKMINDNYIDELEKLFKNEKVSCSGNVTVSNNNGNYIYSPYLDCGKDYKSTYLKDKIIEDTSVTQGVGLYKTGNTYIMKGEVDNNYVQFAGQLFRILRINEDGTIRLFQNEGINQIVWDNRFNPDMLYKSGINEFEYNSLNSRIKDSLEEYYNNESVWKKEDLAYVTKQDLCVGKRSSADTKKDGSLECSKTIKDQYFGLLTVSEYLQASLDTNCDKTTSKSCSNYNWLSAFKDNIWTITANSETTSDIFCLTKTISTYMASSYASMNIVINISDKAIYEKGDGTLENPYIFR